MEGSILFLFIALLLHFITFVWLTIVAFKRSVLWGLLVFFLSFLFAPIPAIIFAVTNWFDAKKPFLAYLLTMILVFVPLVMMASHYDEQFWLTFKQKTESGEISDDQAMEYLFNPDAIYEQETETDTQSGTDPMDVTGEPQSATDAIGTDADSEVEEEPEVIVEQERSPYPKAGDVKPDPLAAKKKAVPKDSVQVSLDRISNYKGRYFIVTTKSGSQHRGILVKVTKSRILLERKIYGGTFNYKVLKSKIKRLDMLKKEYVDDGS